jgi:type VI protein secretion system component Hcp
VGSEEAFSDGPDRNSDYYLIVEGLDGGADAKGRALAFAVSSFTFDTLAASSGAGGGAGSGKAEFTPLSVKVDLGSSATRLLERWAGSNAGGFSVQLVGTDPSHNGTPVIYDLRLGDASVASLGQNGNGLDLVSFDYSRFSIATSQGGDREAFGFDLGNNSEIGELAAANGADQAARAGHDLNYRLMIDGIDGGGPKGAFTIDDFSFDVSRGDAGEQASLSVSLDIGSAADELLKLIAKGTHVPLGRLIGNETGKDGMATAYDLRLGDLIVTGLEQNAQGKDVLSLGYDSFSLSTKDDKGKVTTEGFDFSSNTDPGLLLPAKSINEDGVGGTDMNYWLTIDGLNSGGKAKGHEGAFALDGFDLDIANLTSTAGGGSGSGKTVFDPLTVLLDAGVAADELLDLIAKGKFVESISIVGEAAKGASKGEKFLEIKLETVVISQFRQEGGEEDGLALSYDAISFTSWNDKGKSETYGFDISGVMDLDHEIPAPVVGEL